MIIIILILIYNLDGNLAWRGHAATTSLTPTLPSWLGRVCEPGKRCFSFFVFFFVLFLLLSVSLSLSVTRERKCSVWAEDVILTKSDEAKLSDLKAWFF